MFATFSSSSQSRCWMFDSADALTAKRQAAHEAAVTKLANAEGDDAPPPPVPREDGELICAFYESKLQEVCKDENARDPKRFTNRVLYTAQSYFKRFYLNRSPMVEDPKGVMLASLYLAGKVEEERIVLADLVPKYAKLQEQALLAVELRLMEALRFQLVVRSPFRALTGLLHDLHAHVSAEGGAAGAPAPALAQLEALHPRAIDRVCTCLKADAPLMHPPQRLALAALLGAWDASDGGGAGAIDVRAWITRRFGGDAALDPAEPEPPSAEKLFEQLGAIDQLAPAHDVGAADVRERLKAVDSRLKPLIKHARKIEKAREERLAAAEEAKRDERRQAKGGERRADAHKILQQVEELRQEAHAAAAARLGAAGDTNAENAAAAGEQPFVVRKRRRNDDGAAAASEPAAAAVKSVKFEA